MSQNNNGRSGAAKYFEKIQANSFEARADYQEAQMFGGVDEETFRQLANAFYRYWDFLVQFQDHENADWPEWIDEMGAAATETVTVETEKDGPWKGTEIHQRPKLLEADPEALVKAQRELDKAASELGLGPALEEDGVDAAPI